MKPSTVAEAADLLRECTEPVRIVGAATKRDKKGSDPFLSPLALSRVLEHNAGDLTAVLEAGVRLKDAQEVFAQAGQMLALDPPHDEATVGGVVAAADSGPLRHRYGGVRDVVVGIQVVLSDGTVARAGGKVIKNVAGYDLAKLFAGSQGTLGLIASVAVRLHPIPRSRTTVAGATGDPDLLGRAAIALAHAPLEPDCLDVAWRDGGGRLLVRLGETQAGRAAQLMRQAGLEEVAPAPETVWDEQRNAQKGATRVAYLPSELPGLIRCAGTLVARAGLGVAWVSEATAGHRVPGPGTEELTRRVKARFDPKGILV